MTRKDRRILKIVGLAVALPSSILSVFGFAYYLTEKKIISSLGALIFIILIISYSFLMMIKYANKK